MTRSEPTASGPVAPLYLAGFTTAFGAHGVATVLGAESDDLGMSLLGLGVVLALYDVSEVVLKPLFGALSDRIGIKPVVVGGLLAFAAASLIALVQPTPLVFGIARLAQGAAASAFSPASSAAVARLAGSERLGRYFGRYGAWKSLGYVAGPLIGAGIVAISNVQTLFVALAGLGVLAAAWAAIAVRPLPVLPRPRYTLADLVRQTTERGFLLPTLLLATATAVLGVAVGFLPLLATRLGLGTLAGAGAVALLALTSAAMQPFVGRLRDRGRITTPAGAALGLTLAAASIVLVAWMPHAATLATAALAIGAMTGTVTPLAFAHLASATPPERMGRTMGNAELGRELGDAGGPLLVGAVAAAATLPLGLTVLAAICGAVGVVAPLGLRGATSPPSAAGPAA